jgi:Cof subfamily protein (haloacid dehalogenase superfamily)
MMHNPAQQCKMIVFDLDGTVLDAKYNISPKLVKVVHELRKRNIAITLNSARIPGSVLEFAKILGLHDTSVIALNGSIIINPDKTIVYSGTFVPTPLLNFLKNTDRAVVSNYYHELEWFISHINDYAKQEMEHLHHLIKPSIVSNTLPDRLNKITLIGDNLTLAKLQQELSVFSDITTTFSHHNYLEIYARYISKYDGLKRYIENKNITSEQIMAFGDGENDIAMLSNVGHGVAMENANDHVKSFADDIAPHHDRDGVAEYLIRIFNLKII